MNEDDMQANEYQRQAYAFAKYESNTAMLLASVLGVGSEAGELAAKLEKKLRKTGSWEPETREQVEALAYEIGDVIWFASMAALAIGIPLEDIMKDNLDKLRSRNNRGKIHGNGDNR